MVFCQVRIIHWELPGFASEKDILHNCFFKYMYLFLLSCVLCPCCQHIFEYYSMVFQDKKSDFATPQKAPQLSFACHSGMYCMWGSTSINASDVPKIWAFENAWCKEISSWRPSFHRVVLKHEMLFSLTFPLLLKGSLINDFLKLFLFFF